MEQKNLNKYWFWLLSIFWGTNMTLIGCIVYFFLRITGHKPYQYNYSYVFELDSMAGGMTLGPVILIYKNPSKKLLDHEFGHSLQNCYFGNCMLMISLWSAARYWFRELVNKEFYEVPAFLIPIKNFITNIGYELPTYDSIWFEGTATYLGTRFSQGKV